MATNSELSEYESQICKLLSEAGGKGKSVAELSRAVFGKINGPVEAGNPSSGRTVTQNSIVLEALKRLRTQGKIRYARQGYDILYHILPQAQEHSGEQSLDAPMLPVPTETRALETETQYPTLDAQFTEFPDSHEGPHASRIPDHREDDGDNSNISAGLADVINRFADSITRLSTLIERKLVDDSTRDETISRLHAELEEHKRGLLETVMMPVVLDLITLHDNLGKQIDATVDNSPVSNSDHYDVFVKTLEGFQIEVQGILFRQGITPYVEPDDLFNGARHRALPPAKPAPTAEMALRIHQRVRPGFERNGTMVRPELVYAYTEFSPEADEEAGNG